MATAPEALVRNLLFDQLNVSCEKSRLSLGQWGYADGWALLKPGLYLLVEVEAQQKHPTTNVLKLWPFLEEHEELAVVLGHFFFPDSPGLSSSRGKLAQWLATRLESLFPGRFLYRRVVISQEGKPLKGFDDLATVVL
jgi:hypothetical protein